MIGKVFFLFFLSLLLFITPNLVNAQSVMQPILFEGKIVKIIEQKKLSNETGQSWDYQKLQVIRSDTNESLEIENGQFPSASTILFNVGDNVVIQQNSDPLGNNTYFITDFVRRESLIWLFLTFIGISLFVARKYAVRSLIGLLVTFIVVFVYVLPQLSQGNNPIFISIISTIFILPLLFYLSHGINKKTNIALLSTFLAVLITILLSQIAVEFAKLSGFASEEASFLQNLTQGKYDIKGLLLGGIIIGSLGILDDITITQVSLVEQLKHSSQKISFSGL